MQAGDPRADPTVVDLIELAGLWLAAADWPALARTLDRLDAVLRRDYPAEPAFADRFRHLAIDVANARQHVTIEADTAEEIRRAYRRATIG